MSGEAMISHEGQRKWRGLALVVLSGATFGTLGLFGKWAFEAGVSPGQFLAWRFLLASLLLGIGILVKGSFGGFGKIPWATGLGLGVFGYAFFSFLFFSALNIQSASLTVLLLFTYPLFVALGCRFWFRQKLPMLFPLALTSVALGLTLLSGISHSSLHTSSLGILMGLTSAVAYGAYIILSSRWLGKFGALESTFSVLSGATLIFSLFFLREFPPDQRAWLAILGASVIGTIIPIALFLAALKIVSASEASLFSATEPMVGVFLATLFLNEPLGVGQLGGAVFVLLGFVLLELRSKGKSESA